MRRLNVKLVVWLSTTSIALIVLVGLLHTWQMKRTARVLLRQADSAEEEGDLEAASSFLMQYVEYEPDDEENSARMALLLADIADKPGASGGKKRGAFGALEETLRRHVSNNEVRRRLVDFTMMMGRAGDALEHIDYLLKDKPDDADLLEKKANCQLGLDKSRDAAETFRRVIELDSARPLPYARLAIALRERLSEPDEANEIINRMVDLNPEDAKARLYRADYLRRYYPPEPGPGNIVIHAEQVEQRKEDVKKALALNPDDADTLLTAAGVAAEDRKNDEVRRLLEHAASLHPDDERIIRGLVQLDSAAGDIDAIAERLANGPKTAGLQLMDFDIKLRQHDLDGARKILTAMEKEREIPAALKDFMQAKLAFYENQWLKASKELERLRTSFPEFHYQIDLMLGQCFEMLGESDRRVEAFQRAASENSADTAGHVGLARALMAVNQNERALTELQLVRRLQKAEDFVKSIPARTALLSLLIQRNMGRIESERDWREIDELIETIASVFPDSKDLSLIEASVAESKGDRAAARQLLESAAEKEPTDDAGPWLSLSRLSFIEDGPDAALRTLDEAEKILGDTYMVRSARINYGGQLAPDRAKAEIAKSAEGLEKFNEDEQEQLRRLLGATYFREGDMEKARDIWTKIAERKPNDPNVQFILFDIATREKNEAATARAIDSIKRLFGQGSPEFKYFEARRLVSQVVNGKTEDPKGTLSEARQLVHRAVEQRSGWAKLARFEGDIDVLDGRVDEAITNYERAFTLGEADVTLAREIARLMLSRGRGADAKHYMDMLANVRGTSSEATSDSLDVSMALNDKDTPKAIKLLEQAHEKNPDDTQTTVWLARLLPEMAREQDAEALLRELVQKKPDFVYGLIELVGFLKTQRRIDDARATIAAAEEKLPKELANVIMAQCYDSIDDKEVAEKYLLKAVADKPTDLGLMRSLATFYLRHKQADQARVQLDRLMAAKPANESDRQHVAWANRELALLIAGTGVYRDFQEGLKRLKPQPGKSSISNDDRVTMAHILATRPEADSKLEAIKLLEELKRESNLQVNAQLVLARLYEMTGNWPKCRDEMLSVLGKSKDDANNISEFVTMLLRNNDPDAAAVWQENLEKVLPDAPLTTALKGRLLVKQGKVDEGVAVLRSLLPRPMPRDKLHTLTEVGSILEQLGQYDAAEAMFREYAALEPSESLTLAGFVSRHGSLKDSLDICQKALDTRFVGDVIRKALEALRARQGDATKEDFARVEGWITKAIARSPKDLILQLDYAEFLDLQGRSADVEEMYQKLLKNPEITGYQRALILNNLAYVLAVQNKVGDSRKYIDEAVDILGPSSDLLDTRALVSLAYGDARQAAEDLQKSVLDRPTGTKYFHLARAWKMANDSQAAQAAMQKAINNYELKVDDLPRVEQSTFRQFEAEYNGKPN